VNAPAMTWALPRLTRIVYIFLDSKKSFRYLELVHHKCLSFGVALAMQYHITFTNIDLIERAVSEIRGRLEQQLEILIGRVREEGPYLDSQNVLC